MNYHIEQYDQNSKQRIDIFEAFEHLEFVRSENAVGAMTLTMPLRFYDPAMWWQNQILEIWRAYRGTPALVGETAYFVQDWQVYRDDNDQLLVDIYAVDANWILDTRIVNYAAGSPQAEKTGHIDDIMKAIVRENFLSQAPAERRLPGLECAPNYGLLPSITKGFSHRNVLTVLQELADASTQEGTYAVFDTIRTTPGNFEFRTYAGVRGVDHSRDSGDPRFVGEKYGNLKKPLKRYEHSDERTVIYAGGQGEEEERIIKTAKDDVRIARGYPYNFKEKFHDCRHLSAEASIQAEADAELRRCRPRRIISGDLIVSPMMMYGVHFNFGDIVTVDAMDEAVDCHISSVAVTVDSDKGEQIEVVLRSEDATG